MMKILDFLFPVRKINRCLKENEEATTRHRAATDAFVKSIATLVHEMARDEKDKKEARQ